MAIKKLSITTWTCDLCKILSDNECGLRHEYFKELMPKGWNMWSTQKLGFHTGMALEKAVNLLLYRDNHGVYCKTCCEILNNAEEEAFKSFCEKFKETIDKVR